MDTDILKDEPSAEYSNSIPPVLPAGDVAKSTLFANQISHIEENAQLASPTSSRATPPSKYQLFQRRLHNKIVETLIAGGKEEGSLRDEVLKNLFYELSFKVEEVVKDKLRKEDSTLEIPQRYYLILCSYYEQQPDKIEDLLQGAGAPLWGNIHFQVIFTGLVHRWLFLPLNDMPDTLKRLNVFIKGANKLFWLDLESSTKRFYAIYLYLKALLLHDERWTTSMTSVALELFDLVSKFYFYYDHVHSLHEFLVTMQRNFETHVSELKLPPSHTKINTVNMFVNELVRHLRLMKSESALVQYLEHCKSIGEVPGQKTRARLEVVLLDYATPGSPMYPTRDVRQQAKHALDQLFPSGRWSRHAVHFLFRIFHPIHAPKSLLTWTREEVRRAASFIRSAPTMLPWRMSRDDSSLPPAENVAASDEQKDDSPRHSLDVGPAPGQEIPAQHEDDQIVAVQSSGLFSRLTAPLNWAVNKFYHK
jgi:hypothetical protein